MTTTYQPLPSTNPITDGETGPPQSGVNINQSTPSVQKPNKKDRYKMHLFSFGIAEIIMGALCFVLALIALVLVSRYHYTGPIYFFFTYLSQGMWCGLFPIITGILGVLVKKKPTTCMYNANMAMTIISAVALVVLMSLSIVAATISVQGLRACLILHILITIIAFVCLIVTIVHSAYCCVGVCNSSVRYQGQVVIPAQSQQFVQLANGQYMLVQGQPIIVGQPVVSVPNVGMPMQQQPMLYPSATVMAGPVQSSQSVGPL